MVGTHHEDTQFAVVAEEEMEEDMGTACED
jgi:hypothetical protein